MPKVNHHKKITSRDELIAALLQQGFDVVQAKNNHRKVYEGKRLITTLPSTPSDHRSIRNCVSILKRNGFNCL